MEKKNKKFSLYKLFNPDGKGLEATDDLKGPDDLSKCLKLYKRNITNIVCLNFLIIFGNFPLMLGLFALTGNLSIPTTAASSALYAPLAGAMKFMEPSPVTSALYGVHGTQSVIYTPTTLTYVFLGLSLLVLFTYGFVNTGVTYVLRSIVRREPVSLWSDFWRAIKRNALQALILGALDAVIIGFLIYDIFFFAINASAMMYVNMLILALYLIMRFYLYIMLITFDLSIWKMFKNSLIFALINLKRNIAALFGILLAAAVTWTLFVVFVPAGVILGLAFLFSTCMYFGTFAAYPKIKEIMIDPQMGE